MSEQARNYSIREAVPADYPALVPIADQVHRLHASTHPAIFQPVERASSLPQAWATTLESTVWEFNDRARALYERLGLTTIHRTLQREI